MAHSLTEDDIYRTSTQYRLWSFSPESLAAVRRKTHSLAIERALQYGAASILTAHESLRLIQRYSSLLLTTATHLAFPAPVKATAVQFLRRFYLSNSVLTYPPKEIYKTVLYLACKVEGTHMGLAEFARRISTEGEQVLAGEYKVMQALRFTLEVRQPFRGLKGVLMEMLNGAEGRVGVIDGLEDGRGVAETMRSLPGPGDGDRTKWTPPADGSVGMRHVQDRIQSAYSAARILLETPASLTDVYFLYTPSQLLLAALQLADSPLTSFYLSTKLAIESPARPKILATISSCADMLASFDQSQVLTKDERAELEAKLEKCRDPGTKDLVESFAAMRQDGSGEDGLEDEKAKKRKGAREKHEREGEDLFGPSLGANNG
ncbi:hypothetical protein LTR09_005246 [Extremus antarcticus]|uniref:RNA polymerase II holoenzyme cyclin-like subunit n=1 Tax=Extremus antarcticus TaxID=702011 RepID=A0AAJ0GCG3_9PEZI|nr:hypothetical protein LTR09_005246 [Extremus antarcticus]